MACESVTFIFDTLKNKKYFLNFQAWASCLYHQQQRDQTKLRTGTVLCFPQQHLQPLLVFVESSSFLTKKRVTGKSFIHPKCTNRNQLHVQITAIPLCCSSTLTGDYTLFSKRNATSKNVRFCFVFFFEKSALIIYTCI